MRLDETKETVLVISFTQAKEETFRRSYKAGMVVREQMPEVALWPREQFLYHQYTMKPGMEQKRR